MKILVADDDIISRRPLERALTARGYDLITAADGEEAWAALHGEAAPEMAILDWMMPELSGVEVCRRARAQKDAPYVYVVLLTARRAPADLLDGLDAGADDYLTKPVNLDELTARLRAGARIVETERRLRHHIELLEQAMATIESQQQAILHASRRSAIGEIAGGIAHEINNPLAVVSSSARRIHQASATGDVPAELAATHAARIRGSAARISNIVNGLMSFSKDERADLRCDVPAGAVCEETLSLCRAQISMRGVALTVDTGPPDLMLRCYPNRIKQVLLNLINNAADAAERSAERWIRVTLAGAGGGVEISVSDSGAGVPEGAREEVFRPFYTTKPAGEGAGLGLSIARQIIESHGGTLTLDDRYPPTRFVAWIPTCTG